jgi:uncharacterized protein YneF (UPF0154 family)
MWLSLFLLILFGLAIFASVIYVAISRKSSFKVRIAALIALALMLVTVIVSLFIIFGMTTTTSAVVMVLPDEPPLDEPLAKTNITELAAFILFLLALFLLVSILSIREHRRSERAASLQKRQSTL